jgi:nucleotide-binding universal stress UspA family protein
MYRRILVLLDGSTQAERPIPLAARIARATGGTLILVNVVSSHAAADSDETELARAEDYLAYGIMATYVDALAGIRVERSIIIGAEASVVFATALLEQADILVIGNHDEDESKHHIFDSVAQEVLHHCPVPVLVVPEHYVYLSHPLDGSPLRVLVPLDGSPEAETALEPAAQLITILAGSRPAALQVVHIVQKVVPTRAFQGNSNIDTLVEEEMRRRVATYMTSLARRLASLIEINDHLLVTSSIASGSSVSQAILDAGNTCSMIAMTSHEQDCIAHVVMESITERVLRCSELPVLIIRPHLSELQVQLILPKEVVVCYGNGDDSDIENDEYFAWSLAGHNIDPLPSFYTY